jgi:hypothetical protein
MGTVTSCGFVLLAATSCCYVQGLRVDREFSLARCECWYACTGRIMSDRERETVG